MHIKKLQNKIHQKEDEQNDMSSMLNAAAADAQKQADRKQITAHKLGTSLKGIGYPLF